MSKKYIPSFLRGEVLKEGAIKEGAIKEGAIKVIDPPTRNFSQERSNSSAVTRVSHDHIKEKPVEVPKLAPATLASITSLSADTNTNTTTKGTGSFASKFAEQVRNSENPNYQKPVDLSSVDDFPALGAVRQKNNVIAPPLKLQQTEKPTEKLAEKPCLTELKLTTTTNAPSFAEMASLWAKKKEHEDRENAEFERRKELEEEKMRQAARLMKKQPILGSISRRIREDGGEEEEEGNAYINPDEHSSLGGGSNYEYDEEDSFEGEDSNEERHDDDEDDNPNVGWDGRRKEDLY